MVVILIGALAATAIIARQRAASNRHLLNAKEVVAFNLCSPRDWSYVAEGALNVVLKYVGTDQRLLGYVLRLRKRNPHATGGELKANDANDSLLESIDFVDELMVPLFGRRYVQAPFKVPVTEKFLSELKDQVHGDRPEHRRKHVFDPSMRIGLLLPNSTDIPSTGGASSAKSFCFEIKCKWGFLPRGEWVSNPTKSIVNRFVMHQHLKLSQGKVKEISKYCPLDLFSPNPDNIGKALADLVSTPQNNFRLFSDGKMVFPDADGKGNESLLDAALKHASPEDRVTTSQILKVLRDIFAREPLFERIKKAQQLDEFDVEHAWPMYNEICDELGSLPPVLSRKSPLLPRTPSKSLPTDIKGKVDAVQRFLVSCTAKDCSIMVVLKPTAGGTETADPVTRQLPVELEDQDRTIVRNFQGYDYSISIVDLDPKPVKKMKHFYTLDKEVVEFFDKTVHQNN